MKTYKLGVVINTYDRIEDAKSNMDIIRQVWARTKELRYVKIVHSFNGEKSWYPKKYLEDELVRLKNPGHFQGAAELIDAGVKRLAQKFPALDYVVFLAADTWLVKPNYLLRLLGEMEKSNKYLATTPWALPGKQDWRLNGAAVDFFIVDFRWVRQHKLFPLDYKGFLRNYIEFFDYNLAEVMLEKVLLARFHQAVRREKKINVGLRQYMFDKILNMKERHPVHSHVDRNGFWVRKMYWPNIGLLTHHDFETKRKILKQLGLA